MPTHCRISTGQTNTILGRGNGHVGHTPLAEKYTVGDRLSSYLSLLFLLLV